MKNILKPREQVNSTQEWNEMVLEQKLCTMKMYGLLRDFGPDVDWKYVLKDNLARARAVQVLCLALKGVQTWFVGKSGMCFFVERWNLLPPFV